MRKRTKGVLLTVLSAVFYGFNPLFAKTIYAGGCNAITLTLLRQISGIAIYYLLYRLGGGKSVRVTREQGKKIVRCSVGYALTSPLLFSSYNYLATGLSTTIHFVYPVLVVVTCIVLRYEKADRRKLICCALCFFGILCFYTPGGELSAYGVLIAFASGVAWACYIVSLNASGIVREVSPQLLSFWVNVVATVLVGAIALALHQVSWPTTALSWGMMGVFACVAAAASLLFMIGNKFIGAQSASMLSTFEPLTSVVIGVLVYRETLTLRSGVGIACILLAVYLLAAAKEEPTAQTAKAAAGD